MVDRPRVFLSYSRSDAEAARLLADRLEHAGIATWFHERLAPGDAWRSILLQALDSADVFVSICSKSSTSSKWLAHEASIAVDRAVRGRGIVIPVYVDADAAQDVPYGLGRFEGVNAIGDGGMDAAAAVIIVAAKRARQSDLPLRWKAPGAPGDLVPSQDLSNVIAAMRIQDPDAPRWLQVVGPGGVGKSTAVAEGARAIGDLFDQVIWLSVGERDGHDIDRSIRDLAQDLAVPSAPDGLSLLKRVFSSLRVDRGLLTVADDVWDGESAVALFKAFGPGDLLVTTSRIRLAPTGDSVEMHGLAASDIDRFVEHRESILADTIRTLGAHHAATLTALSDAASACFVAGRLDQAVVHLERLATDGERLLGPDHPTVLNSRSELAVAYAGVGRLEDATQLLETTCFDLTQILGPDAPSTQAALANLRSIRASASGGQ